MSSQKTPMFLSNDATVTSKNQESNLFGMNNRQGSMQSMQSWGDSQPGGQNHLQSIYF